MVYGEFALLFAMLYFSVGLGRRIIFFMINLIQHGLACVTKCKEKHFYHNQNEQGKSHGYFLLISLGSSTTKWVKFQRVCKGSKVFYSCY